MTAMSFAVNVLDAPTSVLGAAIISAVVTGGITIWTKRSENRHKMEVDYEYEQRRKGKGSQMLAIYVSTVVNLERSRDFSAN